LPAAPLKPQFTHGFVYSDGWVDDARLVVLNASTPPRTAPRVLTRTACTQARRGADGWTATLQPEGGAAITVSARALVNAAGPWAAQFLARSRPASRTGASSLRLVKGSHIVVQAHVRARARLHLPEPRQAHHLRHSVRGRLHADRHHRRRTARCAVGQARIDADEVRYLCEQASRYFAKPVTPADVVWSYAGVRPLLDDESGNASAVTRDYLLELDTRGGAPLLNVWGGKITTFRKLAEEAADLLCPPLGAGR
jgi:glycerol-3-phosphate dehydrogenase